MITLIADSGSTKTEWCIVEPKGVIKQILTKGINPFFQSKEEIDEEIKHSLLPHLNGTVEDIHFYGAGCTPEKQPEMQEILSGSLPVKGRIEVNSDMLGAARGLCGNTPGIVCIMGTGSNSCFYNGRTITTNVPPLGFILGDEGSGAVLGKLLVGDILKNQMPEVIKEKFMSRFELTQAEIIEKVYRKPFPNRFLASLSPFLAENIQEPEIHALLTNAFQAFFKRNVMQYEYRNYTTHLIGSIAFYYQEIIKEVAKKLNIRIDALVQSPMQGLIQFHTQK